MKKKKTGSKKAAAIVTALIILLGTIGQGVYAVSVNVTIPTFSVTINGTKMDNSYSEYPCIVYKGITYFPMTYYDCRFLGLETDWSQESGLRIAKTGTLWEYKPYTRTAKNGSSYSASTASGAITVNGEAIDNGKEEYPLLVFRNVTYFPLTWRFAVESFGWEYDYTDAGGLVINAGGSGGSGSESSGGQTVKAREVILPVAPFGDYWGGFVQNGDYYYYQGAEGHIYQAPVSNPADRKSLHQLPDGDFYVDTYRQAGIWVKDGKTYLGYRIGGATMGSDQLYLLGADGSCTAVNAPGSNITYQDFGEVQFSISFFTGESYYYYKYKNDVEYTELNWSGAYRGPSFSAVAYLGNDTLMVLENKYNINEETHDRELEESCFYRYNLKTGAKEGLTEQYVDQYVVKDQAIYFYSPAEQAFFSMPVAGGTPQKLGAAKTVYEMAVVGDNIFYTDGNEGSLYMLGREKALVTDTTGGISIGEQNGYLKVRIYDSQYKYMIFDKDGNEVAKTIENVVDLYMDDSQAVYVKGQ